MGLMPCVTGSTPAHCIAHRYPNIYEDVEAEKILRETTPAMPAEYGGVLEERKDVGYNVYIMDRYTTFMRNKRIREYQDHNPLDT